MKREQSLIKAFKHVALMLVLPGMLVTTGCGGEDREGRESDLAPVAVDTALATMQEVPVVVRVTGAIEPAVRVSPGTKIMGRIESVTVREGDLVSRGQILARIEKRDLDAAVTTAVAAVAMAEANMANAHSQYGRMVDLHRKGSVTDKNLEDATAGFRVAEAAVEQARANLSAAEVTRTYAEIRSPINGFVVRKMAEAGDIASPGRSLFTLEDLAMVKVVLRVPESELVGLSVGSPIRVEVEVLQRTWEAKITRIIPAADPAGRTYDVQVDLPNPEGSLWSGMFARGSFERGVRSVLLVPESAVVRRGQLDGLFIVGGDAVARLRWIRPGQVADGKVEIISGLSAGERFLLSPPAGFVDATPVQVR